MPDLPTLITAFYGTLIVGGGYSIIWLRHRLKNKISEFYEMNSYDKAVQSLIFGTILVVITSYSVRLPLRIFEQFDNFLETVALSFIINEIFFIVYLSFLINVIERIANKQKILMKT